MKDKIAFTLAEILITLTILGIISAITIPSVYSHYEKTVNKTRLKIAYARLSDNLQSTLAVNSCWNISCAIEKNNISISDKSQNNQLAKLKLFFPDAKKNSEGHCIPDKLYSLSGYEYGAYDEYSDNFRLGGRHFYAYCLDKKTGLLIHNDSLSDEQYCKTNKYPYSRCFIAHIYIGNKKDKAVFGKNLFYVQSLGDAVLMPNTEGKCDISDKSVDPSIYPNGSGCFREIINNNWKMKY